MATSQKPRLFILDYGAGNVRSLANSISRLGYEFEWIESEEDFAKADVSSTWDGEEVHECCGEAVVVFKSSRSSGT
jgi:hypothetical protein